MFENKTKIEGPRGYGKDIVLVREHDDLVAGLPWADQGFIVTPFLSSEQNQKLISGLENIFLSAIREAGLILPPNFAIDKYHELVNNNQELHLKVIEHTKLIWYSAFPLEPSVLTNRIAELIGVPLTTTNPNTKEDIFHLRIIRPGSTDFNPLHRDGWLDELKGSINLYVPVAGSNQNSSLFVVPGSHYWMESEVERTLEGAIMNGAKYNVPALTNAKHPINLVRPNPGFNEALVFSPYLIHGGATNLNKDQTRVSLEIRLWRKSQ